MRDMMELKLPEFVEVEPSCQRLPETVREGK